MLSQVHGTPEELEGSFDPNITCWSRSLDSMADQDQNTFHHGNGKLFPSQSTDQLLPASYLFEFRVGGLDERPIKRGPEVNAIQSWSILRICFHSLGCHGGIQKQLPEKGLIRRKRLDERFDRSGVESCHGRHQPQSFRRV